MNVGWRGTARGTDSNHAHIPYPVFSGLSVSLEKGKKAKKNVYRPGKQGRAEKKCTLRGLVYGLAWGLLLAAFLSLITVLLLWGYQWLTNCTFFSLKKIEIQGNHLLSRDDVLDAAGVPLGKNVLAISILKVEQRLIHIPWVARVSVRRILPDKLRITVREKIPCFWVVDGSRLYYADKWGNKICPVSFGENFISLPVLRVAEGSIREQAGALWTGEKTDGMDLDRDDLLAGQSTGHSLVQGKQVAQIVQYCNEGRFPFGLQQLSWIRLDFPAMVSFFLRDQGMRIRLELKNLDGNSLCLKQVWQDLAARGELQRVRRILICDQTAWVGFR